MTDFSKAGDAGSSAGDASLESAVDQLLRSADRDAPSDGSLRKAALALGVPFATVSAAVVTSAKASAVVTSQVALGQASLSGTAASGVVASTAGAGVGAVGASGFGAGLALSVVKAVSIGLLVGGATIGTVHVVSKRGAAPTTGTAVVTPRVANGAEAQRTPSPHVVLQERGEAPRMPEPSLVEPLKTPVTARDAARVSLPHTTPDVAVAGVPKAEEAPALSSSVQAELAALSPARAALRSGNGPVALLALGEYDTRFPAGTLRAEALVLRVEAVLLAQGRAAAEAEGMRFIKRYPNSIHRARLERLGLVSHGPLP